MNLTEVLDIRDAYKWLATVVPPGCDYLEIGVCEGGSLVACVQAVKPGSITLCDTWGSLFGGTGRGPEKAHSYIALLLKTYEHSGEVKFIDGDSSVTIPKLEPDSYDLVLVDGDHSEEASMKDLVNAYRILKPGGYLLFDDIDHRQHPYLRRIFTSFWTKAEAEHVYTSPMNPKTYGCGIVRKPV
jgi:predicted O-methyltransferase YrrM